ncbi:hypothetical protein CROQUDRAFT_653157 [Cronartium quercuum f. sp. fusiforme G11]|uniref:alanine--glyoxylate transaminase n=1 Tax=Cronartium quercuum f. sp. fusiforme G11 TaxID=708437 RepID=A0A9P6NQL0_9BASI|nr:hypothetical protein CROQUDRAFT_653157 [Cronartium quercuum f. sp. fusiforme G11]
MTLSNSFTQNPHKLLVIPGPIEVSDAVLHANASASVSHVSPEFVQIFKQTLAMVLEVLYAPPTAQPFVIAGSGTLGWDMAAANLIEPGEEALVLNNGYFADSFKDCLETYGAKVETIQAELGHTVTPDQLASHLKQVGGKTYKLVTITHCDTSTSVLADAKALATVIHKHSPSSLVVLDAVCSVASEEIRFGDWGLDLVLTASQKGLGCPPGLCIFVASDRAVKVLEERKSRPGSYYASWKKWLPIMKAYQAGNPAYFATPPTNLITALYESLKSILRSELSLEERFECHKKASDRVKKAVADLGLRQLPVNPDSSAHGMTAVYLPEGITPAEVVGKMSSKSLIIAGGLHQACKDKYIRIGHMGLTAVADQDRGDVDKIIVGLVETFKELGFQAS